MVIAQRAGLEQEAAERMLKEMAEKGLCGDVQSREKPTRYMAAQFAIGIWEYQVKRLTPELAADVGEYLKTALQPEVWRKAPQLRTIPVRESITVKAETLPYEQAELLLRQYDTFAVAPCICREEKSLVGEGCGKPLETCLLMGGAAKSYMRHLRGREITLEEALGILETADRAGLVLQPGNIREAANICCCCGDCCGVLRNLKQHPAPASIIASAYYAVVDEEVCAGCETCVERCQMEAITVNGTAHIDLKRCIGCGLCVTTCTTGSAAPGAQIAGGNSRGARKQHRALPEARPRAWGAFAAGYRENGGEIGNRPDAVQISI